MKEIIVLLLTFAILAVQYHLGLMRKPGFGAVLPAALAALFRTSVRAGRGCGLGSGPAEGR